MYFIYFPMQKNKLQTLKMYLFNFYLYIDSSLNFQKYLKNTCETPQYRFWFEQIHVADNNKMTLSDYTSHETEAIFTCCAIYKLTYISMQPLCPVCLLVTG